ncbi:hypothetical protein LSM04_005068 [Trypanosoma melophagium]|uniref:uncharacterized protein n=1 Tax=Trypanosoma melophagium TaxID=715481 RepID=UPI00351A43E4|nr:hypothetical protein LSM04_005068 [Trypanosoma melophagium]
MADPLLNIPTTDSLREGRRQLHVSILPPDRTPATPTKSPQERPAGGNTRRESPPGRTDRLGSAGRPSSASRPLSGSLSPGRPKSRRSPASTSSRSTATPDAVRRKKGPISSSVSVSPVNANSNSSTGKKNNLLSPRGRRPSVKSSPARRSVTPTLSSSTQSVRRSSTETRRRKMRKSINLLIAAEDKARTKVEALYYSEWVNVMQAIAFDGFDVQRRFIKELVVTHERIRSELGSRAEHAEDAVAKLVKAINHLIESINIRGTKALEETKLLENEIPFSTSTYTPMAEIFSCAQDPSALLKEPYVPVKPRDSREPEEIAKIESFFKYFVKTTGPHSRSNQNERNSNGNNSSSNTNNTRSNSFMSFSSNIDVNSVLVKVDEAYNETLHLSDAFSALIDRTHRGLQHSREMIRALQQTLNENSTRVKVADDILRETTGKNRVEVDSAIRLCGLFGMELRRRMDTVEKQVRDALDELIQRSTEISIENNAFHDQAQLLLNKENTMWRYMSRMEMVTVEQGKLLRDVRQKLLQLWKERSGDGDEERTTLKHSGLPTKYHAALESCDRDTLLRLLHFVSLNGNGVAALLIGALDEHASFVRSNTEEAQAVVKRCATEAAVTELLEKLYEEGEIKCNPRRQGETLADTIKDMVLHYNTYMETREKQQKRTMRMKAVTERLGSTINNTNAYSLGSGMTQPAFFDQRTPVPEEYAVDIASRPSLKIKRPAICDGNASRYAADDSTNQSPIVYNTSIPTIKAKVDRSDSSGVTKRSKTLPEIEASHIMSYLQQSHPSELDPPGTATIVGYGRWGGKIAKHCEDSKKKSTTNKSISTKSQLPPATSPRVRVQQLIGQTSNPPPAVPTRKTIIKHMLEDHCHDVETLFSNPKIECKCIRGEDEPFLKLQRELFEEALS